MDWGGKFRKRKVGEGVGFPWHLSPIFFCFDLLKENNFELTVKTEDELLPDPTNQDYSLITPFVFPLMSCQGLNKGTRMGVDCNSTN